MTSPTSTIYIGLNILVALCTSTRQRPCNTLFEQQSLWILDTCDELWHYFQRWTTGPNKGPLHDETVAIYMQLVGAFASLDHEQTDFGPGSKKAALMAISSIARLVETLFTSPLSESNQTQLALLLTRLCHLAQPEAPRRSVLDRRRQPPEVFETESLSQNAKRICENSEVLSALQKDLQVWALRC